MPDNNYDHKFFSGFTLVELLVAVSISAIIGATVVFMLNTSLETWRFGEAYISIDKINQEILDRMTEGTFELPGLRDATEIYQASGSEIVFVPLQKDLQILDRSLSEGDKIFLQRQFKAGTNDPIVETRYSRSREFTKIDSTFYYGELADPGKLDDYVVVEQSIPVGSEVRIIYRPEANADPWVRMRYIWEVGEKKLYYTYQGITIEVPIRNPDVEIERVGLLYFANVNAPILPSATGGQLSSSQLKRITAVKIIVESKKTGETREAASFINIR
ncbi:MAG: prepilin-type N-terminal cleavage/methylation domain-containing protein, partial [Candidatus Omnitrophota bacterium]